MWYIETADSVDFSDNRWEVLFLVQTPAAECSGKHLNNSTDDGSVHVAKLSYHVDEVLVGYFTLFSFRNPFAGCKIRICQALIFPPYQSKGFGKELLHATYSLAK